MVFKKWGAYSQKKSDSKIAEDLEFLINDATLDNNLLMKLEDPRSIKGNENGLQIKYNKSNYSKSIINAYEKLITKIVQNL